MPDIGWAELAVVAVIALVVVGPKDLPRVLRTVGGWARKARAMAREFQGTLDDMVRESEFDEIGKDVKSIAGYDVTKELENAIDPTGGGSFLDEPVTPLAEDKPPPVDEVAATDEPASADDAPTDEPAAADDTPEGEPAAETKTRAAG